MNTPQCAAYRAGDQYLCPCGIQWDASEPKPPCHDKGRLRALRPPRRRNTVASDLRTPKYRARVVPNKKRQASKEACRNPGK